MHGHMPPQQHPGMHPAHQPPHMAHMTNLPPHGMQRDHPANRLNNGRHHHPRAVDHQGPAGMAPHLPMQVPPPSHQPHQSQITRKPPSFYIGGLPKPLPLTSPHLHASPPGLGVGQPPQALPPHQQPHPSSMPLPPVVGGSHPPGPGGKLPYGMGSGPGGGAGGGMGPHQQPPVSLHHPVTMAPPHIPVVSAATPAGTKTRHIPSNTDHKIHHHGHNVLQANGNNGPGSKGIASHHQSNQLVPGMDKTKTSAGIGPGGGNRHHHNHHHNNQQSQQQQQQQQHHQQQQHLQQQHPQLQQQQISTMPIDPPLPKKPPVVVPVEAPSMAGPSSSGAASAAPSVPPAQSESISTTTPAGNGTSAMVVSVAEPNASEATPPSAHSPSDGTESSANMKEKTTMCLVNELARYNKIEHQYRLTGESGPAHKKHFTVTLKLGDEEYTAEGASIKKAQHKAAGDAIAATKYKHPPARTNRRTKTGTKGNVSSFTPTVELNALAMKRGEPTVYQVKAVLVPVSKYGANGGPAVPPPASVRRSGERDKTPPGMGYGPLSGGGYWGRSAGGPVGMGAGVGGRGGMGGFHPGHQQQQPQHQQQSQPQQHNHQRDPRTVQDFYKATLRVGERTFLGEGHTPQAARHDAAARALEVLKPLTADGAEGRGRPSESQPNGDGEPGDGVGPSADGTGDPNAELKSPISLVHEMAVQRSLSVVFEVISEKGPPHMTVFVTQCKVGSIVTEGEGNGKKMSKKRAAEKMLEELRKLQLAEQQTYAAQWGTDGNAAPGPGGEKRKSNSKMPATVDGATAKKKARNLVKEKSVADVAEKENPISRLMQIQQARKEKQPVYALVENDRAGAVRRRQFTIEVSAGGRQATGTGMTKKAAKWNAAEALLLELGYVSELKGSPPGAADGAANKENQSGAANDLSPSGGKRPRKVKFQDEQGNRVTTTTPTLANGTPLPNNTCLGKSEPAASDSMNDSISSNDSTVSSGVSSASSMGPKAEIGAKKEQLLYLAQLLKFEVQFSDFPKGNHGEYLTLVKLSTEPPQLCHGIGASQQASHDDAARSALEILSKIGLDNVKPKAPASNAPEDAISSPVTTSTTPSPATAIPAAVSNGN